MAAKVIERGPQSRFKSPTLELRIVSKARWSEDQVGAYVKLLPDMHPNTAKALVNYTHDDDLFSVNDES